MKVIRKADEDLGEMLKGLKVGDAPIFDSVSLYEITKVRGGFIYKNEYCGLCYVPDVEEKPRTMAEKKVEKPARKVVTK